jgi:hypothetical protein
MRGDIVYRVYGLHAGRDQEYPFGTFRTRAEARAKIEHLRQREMHGRNWAEQYHNQGFVVRETVVETEFEIPPQPKPRDKYAITATPKANQPGTWDSTIVEVWRRASGDSVSERICEYERNYSLLQTFEPFRQGGREYALIARDYTKTAVLDLESGDVIAEEADLPGAFCPVGFYVPDWWDLHDGSIIPGSVAWSADYEWPTGDFGFVWGCVWGDDCSWKVQYLDLSQVQQGIVCREERFGYVELATIGFKRPCVTAFHDATVPSAPPPFIQLSRHDGVTQVTFAIEMRFDLNSGQPQDWKRVGSKR